MHLTSKIDSFLAASAPRTEGRMKDLMISFEEWAGVDLENATQEQVESYVAQLPAGTDVDSVSATLSAAAKPALNESEVEDWSVVEEAVRNSLGGFETRIADASRIVNQLLADVISKNSHSVGAGDSSALGITAWEILLEEIKERVEPNQF